MDPQLSRAEVSRLAALAHLEIGDAEAEMLRSHLARFLAYAQQVQGVDTAGIPPTTHVLAPEGTLRDDEPREGLPRDRALQNAPDAAADTGLFRVPRVIGG
jgi:aspartyl-tRNA(Asn)/glutamyl-tRNA(Gln) amidotransferase subunit C